MSFAQVALGQQSEERARFPEVMSPAQAISEKFLFQSFFDNTAREAAILEQPPNEPIVPSTRVEKQISGWAVGLHPSSEVPLAVEFRIGNQSSSSAPLTLKPGQIVRPFGGRSSFSGIRYGLPFGWLGGGIATLVVFPTPDARASWSTDGREIIFHRQRLIIKAAGSVSWPYNWPTRFPWTRARRLVSSTYADQTGQSNLSVVPTRTLMSLRLATLAAPATMSLLFRASDAFGLNSAETPVTTEARRFDVVWGTQTTLGIAGVSDFPFLEIDTPPGRLAANDGSLELVSADVALIGAYVDVVRYGVL